MFSLKIALLLWTVISSREGEGDARTVGAVNRYYKSPPSCSRVSYKGGKEKVVRVCLPPKTPKGWKYTPGDLSKPYPDCCGQAFPPLELVPDVLDRLPPEVDSLDVTYGRNDHVESDVLLTPTQARQQPRVEYLADSGDERYMLLMVDPDVPSRQDPELGEFLHWMVGNIPGDRVSEGEVLAEYVGPAPPEGTFFHRYFFLLYRQPSELTFNEERITNSTTIGRMKFSAKNFAKKYDLYGPVAVNVFQSQYDD